MKNRIVAFVVCIFVGLSLSACGFESGDKGNNFLDECRAQLQRIYLGATETDCNYCDDSSEKTIYSKEYDNYYCSDCTIKLTSCVYCGAEPENSLWREERGKFFCDRCYEVISTCQNCMDNSKPTAYSRDYGGYFCEDCASSGLFVCCGCGKLVERDELFEHTEEDFYCISCYGE